MNRLFKHLIPFIFAALFSLPAQAVTMNGCETTAMQGCSASIFGPTAPFLIDEDFTAATNPPTGWTKNGNSNVVSGEVVSITSAGSNDYMASSTFTAPTEVWAQADVTLDVGGTMVTFNHIVDVFLISDGGSSLIDLNIIQSSGLKFQTKYRTDAGQVSNTLSSPVFNLGQTYKILQHFKQNSGVDVLDGVYEMWIDDVQVLSLINADNDTRVADNVRMGAFATSTTAEFTVRNDNITVSVTGVAP